MKAALQFAAAVIGGGLLVVIAMGIWNRIPVEGDDDIYGGHV